GILSVPVHESPVSSRGCSPIVCARCGEVCRGEVVRVKSSHFHVHCFTCQVCGCDLVQSGFFHHSGEYICTEDYQRLYGTQCDSCEQYISGEVVSALGRTYHPQCFVCSLGLMTSPQIPSNRAAGGLLQLTQSSHVRRKSAKCSHCHRLFG
uniref:Actin binding LIM protein family member 3 n=1 Tax=Neogobius melanostomus TaxID=47308 RepID=A0A8C6SFU1_9GOBI